jgi:ribonuclease Z
MRELVVLGTASQAPTRYRNHNGYFLRLDETGILFDPGEGTQRQMLLAGVRSSAITDICITHFHGDHCLGLPGVVQRLSLDEVAHEVGLWYPASGQEYLDRLLHASVFESHLRLRLHPVADGGAGGPVPVAPAWSLSAARLDHDPEALGWRLEEPAGRTMLPDRLEAAGVRGPDVGLLQQSGLLQVPGRVAPVRLEEVSVDRPGQVVAFVMDTAECPSAEELARDADLLVCEATFASAEEDLAGPFGHMTAAQAGRLAKRSGARRLVITHFSQRYPDEGLLLTEAAAECEDVVAARDLLRVPLPPRRQPS